MTKNEFISALAKHGAMSKADADKLFQVFRHTLETELPSAGKIAFPGFLTFEVAERAARKGRNPATGQEIEIPAKKTIKVKVGKEFADTIKG